MTVPRTPFRRVAALASCIALAGCGPQVSLHSNVREYSTDILYGSPTPTAAPVVVPAPVVGANISPSFPGYLSPPLTPPAVRRTVTPPPLPPVTCGKAPITSAPATSATPGLAVRPSEGAYTFRQKGTETVGGTKVVAGPVAQRLIEHSVLGSTGSVSYDLVEVVAGVRTTTTFVEQRSAVSADDGLYITHIRSDYPDGTTDDFTPATGVRLISLDAQNGSSWTSVATDPLHSTSIVLSGVVDGKQRVDACGTVLDAWLVRVSGSIISPSSHRDFVGTYAVGTQFGGLVLAESIDMTGTSEGSPFSSHRELVIDGVTPEPAAGK